MPPRWFPPVVAGGDVQGRPPGQSPARPSAVVVTPAERDELRKRHRGALFDEAEVERIRARIAYGELPFWRRLKTRAPEGWR